MKFFVKTAGRAAIFLVAGSVLMSGCYGDFRASRRDVCIEDQKTGMFFDSRCATHYWYADRTWECSGVTEAGIRADCERSRDSLLEAAMLSCLMDVIEREQCGRLHARNSYSWLF